MKALILSYYFPPFNGPGAQHPDWFHRYLPEHGVETRTVSSSVYFNEGHGTAEPDPNAVRVPETDFGKRCAEWLFRKEMQVQLRLKYWEPGFVWAKLYGIPAAEAWLKRERFDALISVSPPISSHWAALRLKRRFPHLRWIADFQDPFLANPFRMRPGPPSRREQEFEQAIFRECDVLSANTDTVAKLWSEQYPEVAGKVTVTWGGYDPTQGVTQSPLRPGPPVLAHVGSLYLGRLPAAFFQALHQMHGSGNLQAGDLVVEFLGPMQLGALQEAAGRLEGLGLVRLRNTLLARQDAIQEASTVHYSLLIDVTPGFLNLQVPAKLFDQIRLGRPVLAITPDNSPTARILALSGIPNVTVPPDGTPETYAAALQALLRIVPQTYPASAWFRETFDARGLAGSLGARISSSSC